MSLTFNSPTFQNAACAFFQACPNIVFVAKWCGAQFYRDKTSVEKRELLQQQVLSLMESLRTIHESVPGGRLSFAIAKEYTPDKRKAEEWTFSNATLFGEKVEAIEANMRQRPLTQDGQWFLQLAIDYCNRCKSSSSSSDLVGKSTGKIDVSRIAYIDVKFPSDNQDSHFVGGRVRLISQIARLWNYIHDKFLAPNFPELASLGRDAFNVWYADKIAFKSTNASASAVERERDLFYSEIEKLESLLSLVYRQLYALGGNIDDDDKIKSDSLDQFHRFVTNKNVDWRVDERYKTLISHRFNLNSVVPLFKRRRNSHFDFILFIAMVTPQLLLTVAQFNVFRKLDKYQDLAQVERKLMLYYHKRCASDQRSQGELCESLVELIRQMEEERQFRSSRSELDLKSGASTTLINALMPGSKASYVSATVDLAESNRLFDALKADFSSDIKKLRDQLNASISNRSKALIHYKLEQFEGIIHTIKNDFAKLKNIKGALLASPVATPPSKLVGKEVEEFTRQYLALIRDAHCLLDDLEKKEKEIDVSRAMRFDASAVFSQSVRDFQTILGYWIEQNLYPLTTRRGLAIVWPSGWSNIDYSLDNLSRRLIKDVGVEGMFIHRVAHLWKYLRTILNNPTGTVPDLATIAQQTLSGEEKAPACAPNMSLFTGAKSAYCAGLDPLSLSYAKESAALRSNVHRMNDEIGHSSAWFAQYSASSAANQQPFVDHSNVLLCRVDNENIACRRDSAKPHNTVLFNGRIDFNALLEAYLDKQIHMKFDDRLPSGGKLLRVTVAHKYYKSALKQKTKELNIHVMISLNGELLPDPKSPIKYVVNKYFIFSDLKQNKRVEWTEKPVWRDIKAEIDRRLSAAGNRSTLTAHSAVLNCKIDHTVNNKITGTISCVRTDAKPHNTVTLDGDKNFNDALANRIHEYIVQIYGKGLGKDVGKQLIVNVKHRYYTKPGERKKKLLEITVSVNLLPSSHSLKGDTTFVLETKPPIISDPFDINDRRPQYIPVISAILDKFGTSYLTRPGKPINKRR